MRLRVQMDCQNFIAGCQGCGRSVNIGNTWRLRENSPESRAMALVGVDGYPKSEILPR